MIRLFIFAACCLPFAARGQTIIPITTYAAGNAPVVVAGTATIANNSNAVTVSAGATVVYQSSTSIDLTPGFHAAAGSNFYATSTPLDSDGDGLPDVWERVHGVSPASADSPTTGGLTNRMEYQLGTNPTNPKQTDSGNSNQLKINRPN